MFIFQTGLSNSDLVNLDNEYEKEFLKYKIIGYMDYLVNSGGINMGQAGRSFVIGDTGDNDEL